MATVNWNGPAIVARARVGLVRGITAATEDVRSEMIRLILDTPKTGRVYVRRTVAHQASAPGEPPASDTGRLVNSVTTEVLDQGSRVVGRVVVRDGKAALLEYGTARMAARPYARPALANMRGSIQATVARHVAAAIR